MSYHVIRSTDGKPQIILNNEPSYCRALNVASSAREPEVDVGWWLVMFFAAWSMHDIHAIQTALKVVKRFGGTLQLGLCPFDDPEEHRAWSPPLENGGDTPLWVLLSDGTVRAELRGLLTEDTLVNAIKTACPGIRE